MESLGRWTVRDPDDTLSIFDGPGEALAWTVSHLPVGGYAHLYGPDEEMYTLVHRTRETDVQITRTV